MKTNKYKTIRGTITPISWDKQGKIVKYSIYTEDDEDILLKGGGLEKVFKRLKNKRVKIFGDFLSRLNEIKVLQVKKALLDNDAA